MKGIGANVIYIKVRFESRRFLLRWNKTHTRTCPVDIQSFEGTDAVDYNWDKKTYEQVKRIADTLSGSP